MSLKDKQKEWARLAKSGDRQALESLTLSVLPWTRRKAMEIARKFGLKKDEWMDLEQEGLSRIVYVLRSYKPDKGPFLSYYASCSARWMSEVSRRMNVKTMIEDMACGEYGEAAVPDTQEDDEIRVAIEFCRSAISPLYVEVMDRMSGFYGGDTGIMTTSKQLGITQERCREIYRLAIEEMRLVYIEHFGEDHAETDPGRTGEDGD